MSHLQEAPGETDLRRPQVLLRKIKKTKTDIYTSCESASGTNIHNALPPGGTQRIILENTKEDSQTKKPDIEGETAKVEDASSA